MEGNITLSITEYFHYMEGNTNSRSICEGEEVFRAGFVVICGVTSHTVEEIKITALVLQTSALMGQPHNLSGSFSIQNKKASVKAMDCSCKAGKGGKCKHISAVLLLCTRASFDQLEHFSQTDLKCLWSEQKTNTLNKYKAVPIKEMSCIQKTALVASIEQLPGPSDKDLLANVVDKLPNSAITLHSVCERTKLEHKVNIAQTASYFQNILNNAVQSTILMELAGPAPSFMSECCSSNYDKLLLDCKVYNVISSNDRKVWEYQRRYRITGSRIYGIFTYKGIDWVAKSRKYFFPTPFSNKYVRHGIKYESEARIAFINLTGKNVVECGLVIAENNPWLGYSPDGVVLDCNDRPISLIEIKCPYAGATESINEVLPKLGYIKFENSMFSLKKKHIYYGQIQLGMALLNVHQCSFIIYLPHDKSMIILEEEFNYEFAKNMLFEVKEKFFKHMWHSLCEK